MDVTLTKDIGLTIRPRAVRTSFTFRYVQEGKCTCSYPEHCDSQLGVDQIIGLQSGGYQSSENQLGDNSSSDNQLSVNKSSDNQMSNNPSSCNQSSDHQSTSTYTQEIAKIIEKTHVADVSFKLNFSFKTE
jgi:hypothetical protein